MCSSDLHLEIAGGEALMRVLVDRVERVHEAVPERIGVDVERRMDEVADIRPVVPVLLVEGEGRAEALGLHRHPDLADRVGRQLALAPLHVQTRFEIVEGDLADHRVQYVLDLAREHRLAGLLVGCAPEQRLEGQAVLGQAALQAAWAGLQAAGQVVQVRLATADQAHQRLEIGRAHV